MNGIISIRIILTLIALTLVMVGLSFVKPILWPFVLSIVLAYIFDPITQFFERFGLNRVLSSLAVVLLFILIVFGFGATILPILISQLMAVVEIMPTAIAVMEAKFQTWGVSVPDLHLFKNNFIDTIKNSIGTTSQIAFTKASSFAQDAFFFVLVPIMLFYLLKDWANLRATVIKAVPYRFRVDMSELFENIDVSVAGFLRGQLTIMLILGSFYSVVLSLLGLNYAIAIGVLTGLLVFIPYVGAFIGVCIATLIGVIQYNDIFDILIIWGIFAFAQSVESVILTPNIVGDKVGLHPVWIMFALMAGGVLFGFIGVLLAVPMTTLFGTLVRFAFQQYTNSDFYKG
ncbi:MAG: AI-2E family transporter [Alphaproteobacteria bacterium]